MDVIKKLEALLAPSVEPYTYPNMRALAYSSLTLARVLDSEWTHVVPKKDEKGKTIGYETVTKPAGRMVGERAELERRLQEQLTALSVAST
jgi:hypothetical protein